MLNSIHVSFLSPNTNRGPLRNYSKQTQLKENQKSQQKEKRHPRSAQQKGEKNSEETKTIKELKTRLETNKKHIKNLSDRKLINDQINLLAKGLKYFPTPVTNEMQIKKQLLRDFDHFARRMRLQYIFHVRSTWKPQVQPSVALESYLEEVKIQLAELELKNPKDNLNPAERETLLSVSRSVPKALKRDTNKELQL